MLHNEVPGTDGGRQLFNVPDGPGTAGFTFPDASTLRGIV